MSATPTGLGHGRGKTRSSGASAPRAPRAARASTLRSGRRGFKEQLESHYTGLTGFGVNTLGLEKYQTTYGEITPDGIHTLFQTFQQQAPLTRVPKAQQEFMDLGCGVGRAVLGMAMLAPGIRARGVEIVPDRIRGAETALARAKRSLAARVGFYRGSFLDSAVTFANTCWFYISNLCFDAETQKALYEKLELEAPVGAVIACSKELPLTATSRIRKLERGCTVSMSWSPSSSLYLYRLVP